MNLFADTLQAMPDKAWVFNRGPKPVFPPPVEPEGTEGEAAPGVAGPAAVDEVPDHEPVLAAPGISECLKCSKEHGSPEPADEPPAAETEDVQAAAETAPDAGMLP